MQKFQDVFDGKLKVTDITAEELPDFVKFGQTKSQEILSEAGGRRDARQAEEKKLADLQPKIEEAQAIIKKAEELNKPAISPEMQPFRNEQVEKAKQRLYSEVKLDDAQKVQVLEAFKKLDSGKMDAEFIYKDLLASVAATQPDRFLTLTQKAEADEASAAEELERQAGSGGGAPSAEEKAKYPEATLKLARDAGISLEAAHKQLTQGNTRVHN